MAVEGFEPYKAEDAEKYNRLRWWHGITWGDMFDKATDLYPAKVGLVDDSTRFTYKELRDKVDRAAIGFAQLGIKQQDFVLVQLPNWHEFVVSFFALQKIGAIVVLLVSRHALAEINYLSSLTNPTAWIVPEQYRNIVYAPLIEGVTKATRSIRHIVTVRATDKSKFVTLGEPYRTLRIEPRKPPGPCGQATRSHGSVDNHPHRWYHRFTQGRASDAQRLHHVHRVPFEALGDHEC